MLEFYLSQMIWKYEGGQHLLVLGHFLDGISSTEYFKYIIPRSLTGFLDWPQ